MCPVQRQKFFKDHFGPCYENPLNPNVTLQDFALVYAVLAVGEQSPCFFPILYLHSRLLLGMLHNFEAQNHSQLSSKYLVLSRACLTTDDFITNTSLSTINTLIIYAGYHYS